MTAILVKLCSNYSIFLFSKEYRPQRSEKTRTTKKVYKMSIEKWRNLWHLRAKGNTLSGNSAALLWPWARHLSGQIKQLKTKRSSELMPSFSSFGSKLFFQQFHLKWNICDSYPATEAYDPHISPYMALLLKVRLKIERILFETAKTKN